MVIIGALVMPIMLCGILLYGLFKRVNVFETFLEGVKDGGKTAISILPALMALVLSVTLLKESGALNVIVKLLEPVSTALGIPPEISPLTLLCPISGSGALTMYKEMLNTYGVDNMIERTASVIMCSTETTFYAIAIYYGGINIRQIRYTLPSALTADFTSFVVSSFLVRLMY